MEDISEKKYKYGVPIDDDLVVTGRIYSDAGRLNQKVYRNGRVGVWKPNLGMRKKDFKYTKISAAMYGEFIAYKLHRLINFPACEVEMLKRNIVIPHSKSGRTAEVPGCISYVDLKDGEVLRTAMDIIGWYKTEHYDEFLKIMNPLDEDLQKNNYFLDVNNENNNNNIEIIIPAFEAYAREKCNATDEQVLKLRQDLINMVVFDCRFGNQDRNDENYGMKVGKETFELYPSFDNEYILGFPEFVEDIEKFSGARLQEHIDKDITSRMGITSQVKQIGYQAMLTYLFTAYPEETKRAYDEVMKISENDLVEIMNECEGLDEIHKDYALRIFRSRNRGFKYVKEEYIDENGNFIPQVLPGNKPMEFASKRGSSKTSAVDVKTPDRGTRSKTRDLR